MRLAALLLTATGCMAMPTQAFAPGSASSQMPATSCDETLPALEPTPVACTCLEDLRQAEATRLAALAPEQPAPQTDSAPEAERRTGALIRVVTGAGGILTGNPPAWALIGQIAYFAASFFIRSRRKATTP